MSNNNADANREWRKRNPLKAKAHATVQWALRRGRLSRTPCSVCGDANSHAHHSDYQKPLCVTWLCQKCHVDHHTRTGSFDHLRKAATERTRAPKGRCEHPDCKRRHLESDAQRLRASGSSYKEIGEALGIAKGTAYKWLNAVSYK